MCPKTVCGCWLLVYIYSAILHFRADSLHLHVILHEWLAFYSTFLPFWQNDWDLLCATCYGENRYQNKSQHRKLTLEKKIICRDWNPWPFNHRSGALSTELSQLPRVGGGGDGVSSIRHNPPGIFSLGTIIHRTGWKLLAVTCTHTHTHTHTSLSLLILFLILLSLLFITLTGLTFLLRFRDSVGRNPHLHAHPTPPL